MYLQEFRAHQRTHPGKPLWAHWNGEPFWYDGPSPDTVLDEVDDTLNSWKEAHRAFDSWQGDNQEVQREAFEQMKPLVHRVVRDRLRNTINSWPVEALTFALLVRWIKDRQADLQMRLQGEAQ